MSDTAPQVGDCWLLVGEAQPRWAAALRVELTRQQRGSQRSLVSSHAVLPPTACLLAAQQPLLACLEATPANLQQRLQELARMRISTMICPIGLLAAEQFTPADLPRAAGMLAEAGAVDTFYSLGHVAGIVELADRHAKHAWSQISASLSHHDLIRRRLPWQSTPWSVG